MMPKAVLAYPIPYATAPSYTDNVVVCYTRKFGGSSGCILPFAIGFAVIISVIMVFAGLSLGWNSKVQTSYGIFPFWVFPAAMAVFFVCTALAYWHGNKRSQVAIHKDELLAKFWVREKLQTSGVTPKLFIQESTLYKRLGSTHLLVVSDDANHFILGAFLEIESAQQFAAVVQQETGLSLCDGAVDEFKVVVGDKAVLGNDEEAMKNRKVIPPISF
jgi:hypothetical protein